MVTRSRPLFVDTAAFFAHFNRNDAEHDRARRVFRGIRSEDAPYGPLFTSRYVLSELATLLRRKVGHGPAVNALGSVRGADSFNVRRGGVPFLNEQRSERSERVAQ